MNPALLARLSAQQQRGKSAFDVARENGFTGNIEQWLASLQGVRGFQGKSAFEIAVEDGFRGSENEWIEHLKGDPGPQGPRGERGQQGPQGDVGPAPEHEWRGTELRFQHSDGSWGKYVDLKGDKGPQGGVVPVAVGTAGASIVVETSSYFPAGW